MNEAKTKVLIVDDDLRLRDLLTRYLSEQGFATEAVVDGTGLDKLLEALTEFEQVIYDVSTIEWKAGVPPVEEINFSAAAAAERWAGGMTWDDLVYRTKAEEGDLVRLLSRTGEALMQVAYLRDSNPQAAEVARQTAEIILREPIR